jgi:hypothetical protein
MELRHQQRGRDTLARDIPKEEKGIASCFLRFYQIAVIAAHHAQRLIVVAQLPPVDSRVLSGKQLVLNLRRELEVSLNRTLLLFREVTQANPDERVCTQVILFYRLVADFTNPVRSVIDSFQSRFDFLEQAHEMGRVPRFRYRLFQPFLSVYQLCSN